MKHDYDIHINNDEIDLVSDRIEELQKLKDEKGKIPEEYLEEYDALFKIKNMLFEANRMENPNDYFVYGSMRIKRSNQQKMEELLKKVHVKDLEVVFPSFTTEVLDLSGLKVPKLDNFSIAEHNNQKDDGVVRDTLNMSIPLGMDQKYLKKAAKNDPSISKLITKIRKKRANESIPHYEEYLQNVYDGYEMPIVSYYPNTTVPVVRNPYPHEMYYETSDGLKFDSEYFGRRNKYYMEMCKFYTDIRDEQLAQYNSKLVYKAYESPLVKHPLKVTEIDLLPEYLIERAKAAVMDLYNDKKDYNHRIKVIETYDLDESFFDYLNNDNIRQENINKFFPLPSSLYNVTQSLETVQNMQQIASSVNGDDTLEIHNVSDVNLDHIDDLLNDSNSSIEVVDTLDGDSASEEVMDITKGEEVINNVPRDILIAAGISQGFNLPLEEADASKIIENNHKVKIMNPKAGKLIDSLSTIVNKRVVEHVMSDEEVMEELGTNDSVHTMSDEEVMNELKTNSSVHTMTDEEVMNELGNGKKTSKKMTDEEVMEELKNSSYNTSGESVSKIMKEKLERLARESRKRKGVTITDEEVEKMLRETPYNENVNLDDSFVPFQDSSDILNEDDVLAYSGINLDESPKFGGKR